MPRFPNSLKRHNGSQIAAGFTLIELLVVISLILLFAGLGVSMLPSNNSPRVKLGSKIVRDALDEARNEAIRTGHEFIVCFADASVSDDDWDYARLAIIERTYDSSGSSTDRFRTNWRSMPEGVKLVDKSIATWDTVFDQPASDFVIVDHPVYGTMSLPAVVFTPSGGISVPTDTSHMAVTVTGAVSVGGALTETEPISSTVVLNRQTGRAELLR